MYIMHLAGRHDVISLRRAYKPRRHETVTSRDGCQRAALSASDEKVQTSRYLPSSPGTTPSARLAWERPPVLEVLRDDVVTELEFYIYCHGAEQISVFHLNLTN